jgi:hypothetical protein
MAFLKILDALWYIFGEAGEPDPLYANTMKLIATYWR